LRPLTVDRGQGEIAHGQMDPIASEDYFAQTALDRARLSAYANVNLPPLWAATKCEQRSCESIDTGDYLDLPTLLR